MSTNIAQEMSAQEVSKIKDLSRISRGRRFVSVVLRFRSAYVQGHVPRSLENEVADAWMELQEQGVALERLKEVADIITAHTRGPLAAGDKFVFSTSVRKVGGECNEGQSQQAART